MDTHENTSSKTDPTYAVGGLFTYAQAAGVLGISEKTVWNLVNMDRILPAVRIGRSVRIDRADLDVFIQRSKT